MKANNKNNVTSQRNRSKLNPPPAPPWQEGGKIDKDISYLQHADQLQNNYIDASLTISNDMPFWPRDTKPKVTRLKDMKKGGSHNISLIQIGTHTGTHLDPPLHMIKDGHSSDGFDIETLIGNAFVLEIKGRDIKLDDLKRIPKGTKRLLFKTANSLEWKKKKFKFKEDFIALTPDIAREIVRRKIVLVGIDYMSIDKFNSDHTTHHILLKKNIIIIENLDLRAAKTGWYHLICAPLKIKDGDGAPARVFLRPL